MTHRQQVTQTLQAIPRERLMPKILRSAFGLLFIGGAVAMAARQLAPWYVWLAVAGLGAHVVSAELTQAGVRFLVATIKDLLAVIRNGKNGAPPA